MTNKKHIAASGAKKGKWVACSAQDCQNGGLHINSSELHVLREHIRATNEQKYSLADVPVAAVSDYLLLPQQSKDTIMQAMVKKAREEGSSIGGLDQRIYRAVDNDLDEGTTKQVFQEHGFTPVDTESYQGQSPMTEDESIEESKRDLAWTTQKEKRSLAYFSTENFDWVNRALHERSTLPSVKGSKANFGSGEIITETESTTEGEFVDDPYVTDPKDQTREVLEEVVNTMDSALGKVPRGDTRTLYRGVRYDIGKLEVAQWVQQNAHVGNQITFEGYVSTSASYNVVNNTYADEDGSLIFEIRTSLGANISSVSSYAEEQEVLMPRNTSYTVAGSHHVTRSNGKTATVVQLISNERPRTPEKAQRKSLLSWFRPQR
jgi:hypothetical protein